MGSNDYYRFANTITPLAHEARRDPDIAQRREGKQISLFGKAQCWRRADVVYVVLRK